MKRNGYDLNDLISMHKNSEIKKQALKKLKPGMSYQQARQFYGVEQNDNQFQNRCQPDDTISESLKLAKK